MKGVFVRFSEINSDHVAVPQATDKRWRETQNGFFPSQSFQSSILLIDSEVGESQENPLFGVTLPVFYLLRFLLRR